MPGSQPQPGIIQSGCSFFDRCNFSEDKCKNNSPQLEFLKELNTSVRCFNYEKLLKESQVNQNVNKIKNNSKDKEISVSYTHLTLPTIYSV